MDVDGLPLVGAAVDLTKVASIHPKRTLAFLNHFICQSVNFLNKFAVVCETKLEEINTKIQRIETTLSILEAKLTSIPGLENINVVAEVESTHEAIKDDEGLKTQHTTSAVITQSETTETTVSQNDERVKTIDSNSDTNTVCRDDRYSKYFKYLQVGIPFLAVKQKMAMEGLDPDLLDTPNAPAPPMRQEPKDDYHSDSDNDVDSTAGSDFSN